MRFDRRQLLACVTAAALQAPLRAAGGLGTIGSETEALLRAVSAGDVAKLKQLLEGNAKLAASVDERGRSAYVLAKIGGHDAVAKLLHGTGLELDLVESVLAEDWERVEQLAAEDPDAMLRSHAVGGSPLYALGLAGTSDPYRLRALGCDPDGAPAGGDGHTPPWAALQCADLTKAWITATDLLSNYGDVNAPQAGGDSLLHAATRRRDERLVRLVLRKGAHVDARDGKGRSALELARELDWAEGATLLEHHDSIDRDHRSSRFAFNASREPVEMPDLSDIPQKLQSEVTGVSHSKLDRLRELVAEDERRVFSISTDAELAIEACGHTGFRPCMQFHVDHGAPLSLPTAVSLGDMDHARFLLDHDPKLIHERGPHDFALMWYAAIGGDQVELAELLLERGVDIDQSSTGTTCLHQAAARGRIELVRFLVERGANIDAVGHRLNAGGQTPLQVAQARKREAVAKLLQQLGARG